MDIEFEIDFSHNDSMSMRSEYISLPSSKHSIMDFETQPFTQQNHFFPTQPTIAPQPQDPFNFEEVFFPLEGAESFQEPLEEHNEGEEYMMLEDEEEEEQAYNPASFTMRQENRPEYVDMYKYSYGDAGRMGNVRDMVSFNNRCGDTVYNVVYKMHHLYISIYKHLSVHTTHSHISAIIKIHRISQADLSAHCNILKISINKKTSKIILAKYLSVLMIMCTYKRSPFFKQVSQIVQSF